ncbi:MFS general substrate transporter [Glonium stellatum]|uniref:MFS general substrate transporter n=1 Tax=Glonium stellatum TaxID=574774 RepID=A0A8E2FA06_9PEZI|nr:MFS general substrate transporter [Glonium stellatum]
MVLEPEAPSPAKGREYSDKHDETIITNPHNPTSTTKAIFPDLAPTHSFSSNTTPAPPTPDDSLGHLFFSFFHHVHTLLKIILLFLNYFLAQYDKFILSYFQSSVLSSLSLTSTQYATLSGYSTGIVYAILAIPIAYLADWTTARAKILAGLALWWSLCVLFQGLSHRFWQMLLARIGMGIGQAGVEALSVSLISDLVGWRNVFLGESVFYVGVYVGEAVSGQIATAFTATGTSWQVAMRAVGITGMVIAVLILLVVREPDRQASLVEGLQERGEEVLVRRNRELKFRDFLALGKEFKVALHYVMHLRSFWLLVLSAAFRQLGGNVFGYYMPSYLADTYPSQKNLLSNYGIIVGVVGSFSVLAGGLLTSIFWKRTKLTPIYLTAIGGMISSVFVLLMLFSKDIAHGNEAKGVKILYGTMCAAYLTAETWLGALFGLVASLLPPAYKTFGLAIWSTVQALIYSSGPEIIGLALRKTDPESEEYTKATQVALAVIITIGYWIAGIGLLMAAPLVKRDFEIPEPYLGQLSRRRLLSFYCVGSVILGMVAILFVVSIVFDA